MKKIYTSDNYIVVDNNGAISSYAKTHSEYGEAPDSLILRKFPDKEVATFGFSEIGDWFDETGLIPFTEETLRTFLRQNSGFSSASGGSEAGIAISSNVIKVDSELGVDENPTDLNKFFKTPKYVVDNVVNNGLVTASTSIGSDTLSSISDADNSELVEGQVISHTDLPFNTKLLKKNNEGGDANTILLSAESTGTSVGASVIWLTIYNIICTGYFEIGDDSLAKDGFNFDFKAATHSNTDIMFNYTTLPLSVINHKLGIGFGTHINSSVLRETVGVMNDVIIDFGTYNSIGTNAVLGSTTTSFRCKNLITTGIANANFGYIARTAVTDNMTWQADGFGLLGGLTHNSPLCDVTFDAQLSTPDAIDCLSLICAKSSTRGVIKGSCDITGGFNTDHYISAPIYGDDLTLGSSNTQRITVSSNIKSDILNKGISTFSGNIVGNFLNDSSANYAVITGNVDGKITVDSGMVKYLGISNNISTSPEIECGSTGRVLIGGEIHEQNIRWTGAGTVEILPSGKYFTRTGLNVADSQCHVSNGGTMINRGEILDTSGGSGARFHPLITTDGGNFVNLGRMYSAFGLLVNYQAADTVTVMPHAMSNANEYGGSTKSTGDIKRLLITAADLATSVDIFDGTNTVTISRGAGIASTTQIISELIVAIEASILEVQATSTFSGQLLFIGPEDTTCTFAALTNCVDNGIYFGGGGVPPVIVGTPETKNEDFNW